MKVERVISEFFVRHFNAQPFFYARSHGNWLRFRVDVEIDKRHTDIFKKNRAEQRNYLIDRACSREKWWIWVVTVPLLLFSAYYLPLRIPSELAIKTETVHTLIDQRIANVAAIVSMTLAVIGFILSNMIVKDSYTYNILFYKSRLYGVIYFILTTLGSLIMISTLKESFEVEGQKLLRLFLMATFLVSIVILLIAYLFRTILKVTDIKSIDDMFRSELKREAKISLRKQLDSYYSADFFSTMVVLQGAVEYTLADAFGEGTFSGLEEISEEEIFADEL